MFFFSEVVFVITNWLNAVAKLPRMLANKMSVKPVNHFGKRISLTL